MAQFDSPFRPDGARPAGAFEQIAVYAACAQVQSFELYERAYGCLFDGLACGLRALQDPACAKMLGPVVAGATLAHGARVPGTSYELDPVTAAFNIGAMARWLDCNEAGFAADWGHPADNLGAVLAVGDYMSRMAHNAGDPPLTVRDLLDALIKAHEIQRRVACAADLDRSHGRTILVRVASAAVAAQLLGGSGAEIAAAVLNAWLDGEPFDLGRAANARGGRASWAAGDANSRGVRLALISLDGPPRTVAVPAAAAAQAAPAAPARSAGAGRKPPASPAVRLPEQFAASAAALFSPRQAALIRERCADLAVLADYPVHEFSAMLVKNG